MISPAVTKLNIPFMHLWKFWMENTRMIGYWSRDPGLISNEITKIENKIK